MNAKRDSAYCVKCHREGLSLGVMCDREALTDCGADREADITSRYEGRCLRCCNHNHA